MYWHSMYVYLSKERDIFFIECYAYYDFTSLYIYTYYIQIYMYISVVLYLFAKHICMYIYILGRAKELGYVATPQGSGDRYAINSVNDKLSRN